jgi:hypothetical protein
VRVIMSPGARLIRNVRLLQERARSRMINALVGYQCGSLRRKTSTVTPIDEQELLRLTSLLESIHECVDVDSQSREAVQKAALALSVAFIHGLRPEIERLYTTLERALSATEREPLLRLGIDPDADPDRGQ